MKKIGCRLGSRLQHNVVSALLHLANRRTGLQAYAVVKQPSSTPQISPLQSIASPRGYSRALQPALSTPSRTSASSLHPSSAFSLRTAQSTAISTLSNATSYSHPSAIDQGSPTSSKTDDHLHWCHICEHPEGIGTCDGYKRHMREHETEHTCMPDGPVKVTEAGADCCFCGASNPNHSNLASHDVFKCYVQYAKRQSYTRRVNLRNHIKDAHNTSEDHASALAKAWGDCHKNRRKFFSCGFCICHFPTLKEQISHLDGKHWSQHQELKEWDINKVILGLLLQPGVKEAWNQLLILGGIDPAFHPEFNPAPQWLPPVVKQVQSQLEIGKAPAAALAELAFQKSSFYSIYQAMISNRTLQPSNWNMEVVGHPSIEQNAISTTHLPDEDFLQISGDSPIVDNRLRASLKDRTNSYHENALSFAQILPEVEYGRFQSNIGSFEDTGMNSQQHIGSHDHSNPFYPDPSGGTMGNMFESEAPSSSPWSTYTASQRPGLAQDPMLSEVRSDSQASFDSIPSGVHMDIASDHSTDQPESYLQHYDSTIMERLSSSVDEATPIIPSPLPARKKSCRPIVIGGSKRKPSSSPTRESRWDRETNPIIVEMGRGSVHEDRFRSRKRIEGYNSHD